MRLLLVLALAGCSFRGPFAAGDAPDPIDVTSVDVTSVDTAIIDGRVIDGTVVDGALPDIALPDTALPDAPSLPIMLVAQNHAAMSGVSTLIYTLTIPPGSQLYLLVAVEISSTCAGGPDPSVPDVMQLTVDAIALAPVAAVIGTPCSPILTRSRQFGLVAPAVGAHTITVKLDATARAVHSAALAFSNVDQTSPVRGTATSNGISATGSVTISSAPGDLVITTAGQGNAIQSSNQTTLFINNVNSSYSLNNSAASSAAGAASVSTTWTFGGVDQWQLIATSLRP